MSESILITGGTGFAGSHLVEALLAKGTPAESIHVTTFSGGGGFVAGFIPETNIHQVDLTQKAATEELFANLQPTNIYHLASVARVGKSFDEAEELLHNNISLQVHVLQAMRQYTPKARLLAILSADAYGPQEQPLAEDAPLKPANPYGISKLTQEMLVDAYAEAFGLDTVKVRPFNHIGERQTAHFVIPAFAQQIALIEAGKQEKLMVGNLEATRDFTDVKDMVEAYILLMEKGQSGQVYNAGSGQGHKIKEILDLLISLSTSEIVVEPEPSRMRPVDVPYIVADVSRLKSLGWSTTIPLRETLSRVLDDWRNQT